MLRRLFAGGVYLSLHESDPGLHGARALTEPVRLPPGAYRLTDRLLVNSVLITLPPGARSGTARWLALRSSARGNVDLAVQIPAQFVTVGVTLLVPAQRLRVEVRV